MDIFKTSSVFDTLTENKDSIGPLNIASFFKKVRFSLDNQVCD